MYLIVEQNNIRDEEFGIKTIGKIFSTNNKPIGFLTAINEILIIEEGGRWELKKIFEFGITIHKEFGREVTFLSGILKQGDLELKARMTTAMITPKSLEKKK